MEITLVGGTLDVQTISLPKNQTRLATNFPGPLAQTAPLLEMLK